MKMKFIFIVPLLFLIIQSAFGQKLNQTDLDNFLDRPDTVFFDNLKKDYKIILHYVTGQKNFEIYYKNNHKYKTLEFDKNGGIVELSFPYNNYYSHMKVQYFSNGKRKSEQLMMGVAYCTDTINNEVIEVMRIDGYYVYYYENGNKSSEVFVNQGKKNGEYKEYYENGSLKLKGYYYNDTLSGLLYHYDDKSNLTRTDTLFLSK